MFELCVFVVVFALVSHHTAKRQRTGPIGPVVVVVPVVVVQPVLQPMETRDVPAISAPVHDCATRVPGQTPVDWRAWSAEIEEP